MKFAVALYLAVVAMPMLAQVATVNLPARYPYTFTNFVWWSDAELRSELARRIPGLPSEIGRDSREESRIRTVLEALLKQKGIQANVQSIEPSSQVFFMGRDPNAPPPAIHFSILSPPEIVIENLVIENAPSEVMELLSEEARRVQGQPYSTGTFWIVKKNVIESMQQAGYLNAVADVKQGSVEGGGTRYAVKVVAVLSSGPKFHVAKIEADGGPLLSGKDLSPYFSLKPGDIARSNPYGMLIGSLRVMYWRAGYADVAFDVAPELDTTHALASYHLKVIPGPIYHLRSLKVEGLTTEQEQALRRNPALKPGAIYDEYAISKLSLDSSQAGPSLKGYRCSFSPRKNKEANIVDLTLSFYKE